MLLSWTTGILRIIQRVSAEPDAHHNDVFVCTSSATEEVVIGFSSFFFLMDRQHPQLQVARGVLIGTETRASYARK